MKPLLSPRAMKSGSAALLAALQDAFGERETAGPVRLTVRGLVAHAAVLGEMSEETILGRDRHRPLVRIRHAIAWVALAQARDAGYELSYPRLGAALAGRDHSTVIHSRRRAEALLGGPNASLYEAGLSPVTGATLPRDAGFAHFVERLHAAAECEPWGPQVRFEPAPPPVFTLAEEPEEEDDAADELRAGCAMRRASDDLLEALRREHPDKVAILQRSAQPRAEAMRAGYVRVAA